MVNLSGKVSFQLLLIVTLVIQPVMTAYAMASMPVSMQHDAAAINKSSNQSGTHEHDACHAMKRVAVDAHHGDHQDADKNKANSDMGDCCHSSACCSIAVFSVSNLTFMPTLAFSAQIPVSWGDVILSSEYKPPRNFLV